MSSTTILMKRASSESLDALSRTLTANMEGSGAELAFRNLRAETDTEVLLMVFEKFYLRTGSYAGLVIECISSGNEQEAVIVGTAGGSGIWDISYGANHSFAQDAEKILEHCGFEDITS